ncbi:MAG: ABC transporter ATP-binding protein [Planctomycetota bacterium]
MSDSSPVPPPAIMTEQLTRCFGEQIAVDRIDLRVEKGVIYGFLGPNGAGKSTTIKMLTGLLQPDSGSIRVLGRDPAVDCEHLEIKRRTGVVPEGLTLFENLTAVEQLAFVGRMFDMDRETIRKRSSELLEMMGLDREVGKLTGDFSHGMRKKLALSIALLPNPDLLFLDEPFEGVDAVTSSVIRDLLLSFVRRGGTVFVTSHVLELVERLCTHVGIIVAGRLVEQTSLEEVRSGSSLEKRFLEKVGFKPDQTARLDWLEGGVAP